MPLDALWNPQAPGISALLPAHEASAGRGFEGFHYLGAGGLALVAAALLVAWARPARADERAAGQRLRKLVPALGVLAILAVAHLPLPAPVLAALDPIRASGRLFWPIGYVLVLMALLAVYRLPARAAGATLAAMLALQAVDLAPMAATIRAQTAEAGAWRLYARTRDPRWDALIGEAQSVAFVPGDVRYGLDLFQEVAWRAATRGRPVSNVYAARTSGVTAARLAAEEAGFAHGALVPGRLYVLLPDAVVPAAAAERVMTLDGVRVIAAH
jgi:phage tail protein X